MQQPDVYYGTDKTAPLISTSEFAKFHIDHITAHPPDSVLFPFLHGLEGENNAQCTFFSSSGTQNNPLPNAGMIRDQQGHVIRPPRYRGLVWVLADEDFERPHSLSWDEDDYDSDSDDFSDQDHDIEMGSPESDIDVDLPQTQQHQAQDKHMHPTTLRISTTDLATNTNTSVPFPSTPLNIAYTNASPPLRPLRDRGDSSASSTESSSSSTDASSFNSDSRSISTCATSLPSPSSASPGSFDSTKSHFEYHDPSQNSSALPHRHTRSKYPILTCSFLPSQLIQPCPTSLARSHDFNGWRRGKPSFGIDWEFKPAKVPDGISLRNFGIQVPLYCSISDIVVYSPKGPTPATFRTAERFRKAIARKRRERLERWNQAVFGSDPAKIDDEGDDPHSTPDGFLKYGVYVLAANAEQLERDLSWLVTRKDGECNGDCEQTAAPARPSQASRTFDDGMTHGLTEATDGRLVGELEIEARLAEEHDMQSASREQVPNGPQVPQSAVDLNANARLHRCRCANTINFAQREKDEMRDLTRASEILTVRNSTVGREERADVVSGSTTATYWNPNVGQVFLGNTSDVPLWRPSLKRRGPVRSPTNPSAPGPSIVPPSSTYLDPFSDFESETPSPFNSYTNDPSRSLGFDICIECHEHAPLPSATHLRAAEEHVRMMEIEWVDGWRRHWGLPASPAPSPPDADASPGSLPPGTIPPRPPPHPSAIIHLPFPSSLQATPGGLNALLPVIQFLERMVTPGGLGVLTTGPGVESFTWSSSSSAIPKTPNKTPNKTPKVSSPWSPIPETPYRSGPDTPFVSTNGSASNGYPIDDRDKVDACEGATATSSYRPRPLKILLYSSDGYTESSVPALCLLMAVKGLSLPEAYLEMQVANRRSFFVYQSEVGLLRKVEAELGVSNSTVCSRYHYGHISRSLAVPTLAAEHPLVAPFQSQTPRTLNRPHALTINYGRMGSSTREIQRTRARASTLPSFVPDHQCWFDDPRFDGSFPSRVLPFLYLGNLNHATNVYMLHALGITHVVSVGECALVPPPHTPEGGCPSFPPSPPKLSSSTIQPAAGQGPGNPGSLWLEEREGRIKVLDIKGVCDDGIDTLEPQLHPICTWIERARLSGGRVLVHCRVGVSRSATVTIAYVMQHLGLSLVEAYLVVRSRRLSVLIQPNTRLLYNLLGWEIRLARERAGGDETKLREELGRVLSWPYLAKEVHALNEKYLS